MEPENLKLNGINLPVDTSKQPAESDAKYQNALQTKFSKITNSTFCPFALKSDIEFGTGWDDELSFQDNINNMVEILTKFTVEFDKKRQDGIVFEITGKDCPNNLVALSNLFRKILYELNKRDPMNSDCLDQDIGGEDWQFEFNGKRLFMITFAPFYPYKSPRQSMNLDTVFIFMQPELGFDKVFPETIDTPRVIKIKDGIRNAFATGGKPYDVTIVDRPSDAIKYIKPISIGDDPVKWWIESTDISKTAELDVSKPSNLDRVVHVQNAFLSFFYPLGYESRKDLDFSIENDETLLFANSTIAKFKRDIISGNLPPGGLSIVQRCLRTWGLQTYLDKSSDFDFNSCFTMFGLLHPSKDPRNILVETINFLTSQGFDQKRIIIKTSSKLKNANTSISDDINQRIYTDTELAEFYDWRYGTEEINGEGITIAYICDDGEERDLGNVIAINDKSGNLVAWESGFGIETIIAIRDNMSLFEAHPIWDVILYSNNPDLKKVADSIVAIIELVRIGVVPNPKAKGYILKKFLNAVYYINHDVKLDLEKTISEYCSLMGYDNWKSVYEKVREYLEKIKESKNKNLVYFKKYLRKNPNISKSELIKIAKASFSLEDSDIELLI